MINPTISPGFKPNKSPGYTFGTILLCLCGLILNSIQQISFANDFDSKFSNNISARQEHTAIPVDELNFQNKQEKTKKQQVVRQNSETANEINLLELHIFRLHLPSALHQKYTPGKSLKLNITENKNALINQYSDCANSIDLLSGAADITSTQTHSKNTQTPHGFSHKLSLNADVELNPIHSASYELILQLFKNAYQLDTRQPKKFAMDCRN